MLDGQVVFHNADTGAGKTATPLQGEGAGVRSGVVEQKMRSVEMRDLDAVPVESWHNRREMRTGGNEECVILFWDEFVP